MLLPTLPLPIIFCSSSLLPSYRRLLPLDLYSCQVRTVKWSEHSNILRFSSLLQQPSYHIILYSFSCNLPLCKFSTSSLYLLASTVPFTRMATTFKLYTYPPSMQPYNCPPPYGLLHGGWVILWGTRFVEILQHSKKYSKLKKILKLEAIKILATHPSLYKWRKLMGIPRQLPPGLILQGSLPAGDERKTILIRHITL